MALQLTINSSKAIKVNSNGGVYQQGTRYGLDKKTAVADAFISLNQEDENDENDEPPKVTAKAVAEAALVSTSYARKVMQELQFNAGVLEDVPRPQKKRKYSQIDHGSATLTEKDKRYLLKLRKKMPGRSLRDYEKRLKKKTGTVASASVISAWFCHCHKYRGGMRKTNPVPLAKFLPRNVERFEEFKATLQGVDPERILFIDEKAFKSMELFGNRTRTDPETGITPPQLQAKDFKHRYGIIGMCSISPRRRRRRRRRPALAFEIRDGNITAVIFMQFIMFLVGKGWIRRHDILVLDNASWHVNGEADELEDFLWEVEGEDGRPLRVLCVFLPTYSPELNPIELVWNIFVRKNRDRILDKFAKGELNGKHAMAEEAAWCMKQITHKDVEGCYRHCGYLPEEESDAEDD